MSSTPAAHTTGWQPATYYPDPAIHAIDPRFENYWLPLSAVERLAPGLRWADEKLPRRRHTDVAVRFRRAEAMSAAEFRALGLELGLKPETLSHRLLEGGQVQELSTTLVGALRGEATILAERLCADPRVLEFEISPRDD